MFMIHGIGEVPVENEEEEALKAVNISNLVALTVETALMLIVNSVVT